MTQAFDNMKDKLLSGSAEVGTEFVPMTSTEIHIETAGLTVIVKASGGTLDEVTSAAERLFTHGRSNTPPTQPVGFSLPGSAG